MNTRDFDWKPLALVPALALLVLPFIGSPSTWLTLTVAGLAMGMIIFIIASGGVGPLDHLADGIQIGGADAVLAASIFHYGEFTVGQAKQHMAERGIPVRL